MTTTMMTTERRGISARTRILGWILLLVAVAVAVIVLATGRALFARIDAAASAELGHEADKFRAFALGTDPATSRPFASVDELLAGYLAHSVPEQAETFFSVVDARAHLRSREDPPARLDRDAAFVAMAARVVAPTAGRIDTTAGPAEYAVIPVAAAGAATPAGRLVVVEFLAPAYDEAWSTIRTMVVISASALAVAAVAGWIVAGRVLAPIRAVRETAARIGETDLGRRIAVSGTDDVAQLAATFNRMLDRLEAAFDGQRRFLDDAGHELRTPITIIRGHLDTMGDDPDERAQTLHLVGDELERMSRLVDDLIMLARSERPGFLLREPTDLADLVVETLAKATALGDRRWSIDAVPIGPDAIALVDGQRLTQALVQLAANAVAHTDPGDAIALGGAVADGRIRLWVNDTGCGIPPDEQQHIFERFHRGPDTGHGHGSGLGLAIVARIAEAHGGTVQVRSAPGEGAAFTIDLPYRAPVRTPAPAPALTRAQEET
ncbi:sensor histidine kinase [Microbacterium luticocti]|uniref:sensor histidine kinase n=1 Tax=Microbacterium luticocti TaxID=451764 RepID=UPI001B7FD790|nr:HAMP domain-containing sensor histidine kinase [Microbacterium luticocti]